MKTRRNLFFAFAGISIMAISILATSLNFNLSKVVSPVRSTENNELLFTRATNTTTKTGNKAVTAATTYSGNTYYLVNNSGASWNETDYPGSNYIANMCKNDVVYFTDSAAGLNDFCFQSVSSISIVLNTTYSREMSIQTSLDAVNWTDNSFYCSSSNPTFTFSPNAHYIRIKWVLDMSQYIKTVKLTYSCSPSYVDEIQSISVENPKTTYGLNDSFVEPDVYATFVSGLKKQIFGATFTGFDSSQLSDSQTIYVSYNGVNTEYQISIKSEQDDLVGTFNHSYFSIVFNSDKTGYQEYGSNKMNFTWSHSGSTITLIYSSGDLSSFGNYRLFSSTTTPNTTAKLNGDTLSITTYTAFSTSNNRTLTRA